MDQGSAGGDLIWDNDVSTRLFRWPANRVNRWPLVILSGIRGGDENCNRTVGLRLPFAGVVFVCLNVPLRQKPCNDCLRRAS
ncbi:hypothetical protein [Streptomyces sp. CBG33]|uniref:hypothetical protein n=1 Tax=Streptomyces sp. CBG33 TaxID=2762624 RepID=UPI001647C3D4|nr:hypothetical protein [Streptomyces sp. CBG33]